MKDSGLRLVSIASEYARKREHHHQHGYTIVQQNGATKLCNKIVQNFEVRKRIEFKESNAEAAPSPPAEAAPFHRQGPWHRVSWREGKKNQNMITMLCMPF